MILWNEQRLKELIRKMELKQTQGQGKTPIHLSLYVGLYNPPWDPKPLLTKIMRLNATRWQALGYSETDRVSVTRYLGSLGCRTDDALRVAAYHQRPLTPELAKLLIDAGCDPAVRDDDDWDALVYLALVYLAFGGHPVDPQVTELFLSAGCRTDLDGCRYIDDKRRSRFEHILKEHALWKESLGRVSAESRIATSVCTMDWGK